MAPGSLISRIRTAPPAWDAQRAASLALPSSLGSGPVAELLRGVAGSSPYLARLIERHGEWLEATTQVSPEATVAGLIDAAGDGTEGAAALPLRLREAKSRAALIIALADLGGIWDLAAVTAALSDLADGLIRIAVDDLLAAEITRERLPGMTRADLASGAGYVVLAMGKHGARELNYSSDIDLICLFDQDRFAPGDFAAAKARYIHVTRQLVKLLSEPTGDGYVFRTDLRLRPAPSTTPVCMAMEAAERYYESLGRTWERAAHIKARPVAGDLAAGAAYLERLSPFIWRRYLDFAAIEETHDMLRKIRAKKGVFRPADIPGCDIKLGPGGIREIEFFAQTRQLIMGGREPRLREPTTLGALSRLAELGVIDSTAAESLGADYIAHRTLEHRLQMVEDAQTHTIPLSAEARGRVAALAGWTDQTAFERDVAERLARVHATTEAFFATGPAAARKHPALDEAALAEAGFERPADAWRAIERWRSGRLPATRSDRARRLLLGLEPRIVAKLAQAASPDDALAEFDRFLSGLPAGVQVFSLFTAQPKILELIVEICTAAPRLAAHLGREPQALDALLAPDFFEPLPGAESLLHELQGWIDRAADYEGALDSVRRWAREQRFRAGVQVLRGLADAAETGAAFSAIAESCLRGLYPRVIEQFAERHGPPPGRGMAVIGLGKLGTREMTEGSDLDLITVYDAGDAESSDGPRPLPPATYFPRLTQALVAALTVPTAEGRLFEVDMRLRPSGRQGPVAVSLAGFERYQAERAWVWEHIALIRARVVAGAEDMADDVSRVIAKALSRRKGDPTVMPEATEMRAKLIEGHARERHNPWALKHCAGGLMEIEFIAQTGALVTGLPPALPAREALPLLAGAGWLSGEQAAALSAALDLMQPLQQIERVALETPIDPERVGDDLKRALAHAGGCADFESLGRVLVERQRAAAEVGDAIFADMAPGAAQG